MKTKILTSYDEPTDSDLMQLMSEVAYESKRKALLVKDQLNQKIVNEIIAVQEKMTAKRK